MQLLLKQQSKDLFNGKFDILSKNEVVGTISFEGKLGSIEANFAGTIFGKDFSLKCENEILTGSNKKFRPYNIIENNAIVGEVYQTEYKKNIFSKYDYIKCLYNQKEYNLYSIGLGEKGVCSLYCNEEQIAEINKDGIIYNDLHNYDIYSIDQNSALIAVLMSCYMYVMACYKPGVKVTESVKKNYSKTTNKDLISKYNSEWIDKVKER